MSYTFSPSSEKPYGVAQVVEVLGHGPSSFYVHRHLRGHPQAPGKRGPRRSLMSSWADQIGSCSSTPTCRRKLSQDMGAPPSPRRTRLEGARSAGDA